MDYEKAFRFVFDQECGHRLRDISLFAYEQYLEQGRGIVLISPDDNSPDKFSWEYSTQAEAAIDLLKYDPERDLLILMKRPDGTSCQFVYNFLDPASRPKYMHELKHKFDL